MSDGGKKKKSGTQNRKYQKRAKVENEKLGSTFGKRYSASKKDQEKNRKKLKAQVVA